MPMLNLDGVAHGNYRCSLAGRDLNRLWDSPRRSVAPTIAALKSLMAEVSGVTELSLFCDFHGHSRKVARGALTDSSTASARRHTGALS